MESSRSGETHGPGMLRRRRLRRRGDVVRLVAWLCCAGLGVPGVHAQRQMEALGRGVVAVNEGAGRVYVSWRLLGTDPDELAFNVYRRIGDAAAARLNSAPLTQTTDFVDAAAETGQPLAYFVRPVLAGAELAASAPFSLPAGSAARPYLSIPLVPPEGSVTPDGVSYTYVPNDGSAADLDGDGEYELILKWDPTNSKDNSQSGHTGNVFLDAYKLNGTRQWRIDLGRNIRAGAHYTQFIVYDLDGDGRAELACKTADGTVDGTGRAIGDPSADFRNSAGYVLRGPEYLTIFDGLTGRALASTPYVPARNANPASDDVRAWGDNYGNRVDRFLAGVAYLDGRRPSLVMCRGYYTRTVLVAWDWRDGRLTQRWRFDTRSDESPAAPAPGFANWEEMGNHQLSVADVDDDGRDEIIYGAIAIDDDGTGLYTTGLGHGDALHVSDMDPDRPGLEVYGPHENPRLYGPHGAEMHDARTGAILWGPAGVQGEDIGRAVAMDIDPRHRGYEAWATRGGLYSARGELISSARPSQINFGLWWDADPLRELLDGVTVSKWDWNSNRAATLFTATGAASNNGTKATPVLSADLLGDWREEVIFRSSDNRELRIYTTTTPAANRLPTLMHDPQYRLAIAWQNVAYNQPPHPGFYLGDGMSRPATPLMRLVGPAASAAAGGEPELANLSVRSVAGDVADPLIVGFVVAGSGRQTLLLRAVGPTLGQFGVADAMPDPRLDLFAAGALIGASNNWSTESLASQIAARAAAVGAFALPELPGRDAALLSPLEPGNYTAHASAATGSRGTVLVELYAPADGAARLLNVSARGRLAPGAGALIAGFVVEAAAPGTASGMARPILIRVVGPALAAFGLDGASADPQLTLFRDRTVVGFNEDWFRDSGATAAAFAQLGAFALPPGSRDAALLLNLAPGAYTVHASGAPGVVLLEVYAGGW